MGGEAKGEAGGKQRKGIPVFPHRTVIFTRLLSCALLFTLVITPVFFFFLGIHELFGYIGTLEGRE